MFIYAGDNKGASACFDIPSYDGTVAYRYKSNLQIRRNWCKYDDNTLYKKLKEQTTV